MATYTTRSIVKAFDLMEIVCTLPRASSLRDVAAEAGMSLATTHRILATLKGLGAIHVAPDGGYELGSKLRDLRTRRMAEADELNGMILRRLAETRTRLNMTMRLATLVDEDMLYFLNGLDADMDTSGASRVIGGRFEAYLHAAGKLLLSQLCSGRICDYISSAPLVAATAKTIVEPKRLYAELREAACVGYAFEDGEFVTDEVAVAVPVLDASGQAVAAISASRNAREPVCLGKILEELRRSAAAISRDLTSTSRGVAGIVWLADFLEAV